ncbi:MAG: VOC family protein [Desulfarculaceae bacterium]|nr:VOC family protein [Desulfarculaceae bacterium]
MLETETVTANTILYCRNWEKTADYYRNFLGLPVNFSCDWFIEFCLTETSRLSIADEKRSGVKSPQKKGITIALQVSDIEIARQTACQKGLNPTQIKTHPWNAYVFYLFDPEGHRIELWQSFSV